MDTESRAYKKWLKYTANQKTWRPEEEFAAGRITVALATEIYNDGLPTPISGDATTCKKAWVG